MLRTGVGVGLYLVALCLMLGPGGGPGLATALDTEADFEFDDGSQNGPHPVGSPNLEATLQDDEDFRHTLEGSGEPGSGEETPTPGYPTTPSGEAPEYFRGTVNFTSLVYTAALGDRNSQEFQRQARQLADAIESLFTSLPGQQVVTVLQFRPGTTDPLVSPSLIVTLDLGTVSFYNRVILFNTINNALNRGQVGDYRVSSEGFSFRPLSVRTCPTSVGREPNPLSTVYNNWANLMLNNIFTCDGNVKSFKYYRGAAEGTAYIGIWRQISPDEFQLKHKFEIPPAPVGVQTHTFDEPLAVSRGDFLGIHYPQAADKGVIAGSQPGMNEVPENEYYQTYNVMLFDEEIEKMGRLVDVKLYDGGLLRKTFSLLADLETDGSLSTTPFPNGGRVSPTGDGGRRTCSSAEFSCWDGRCIESYRKCDGLPDCQDGSDEVGCGRKCEVTEFECKSGQCIDGQLRCNRVYDCSDSSDELNCACSPSEFRCENGLCIDSRRRCDGRPDCEDGRDEAGCTEEPATCSTFEFTCTNQRCIDRQRKCDGTDDCGDGSDELECTPLTCSQSEFTCDNSRCIDVRRKCDRRDDCGDGSDERKCDVRCQSYEFKCDNDVCIDARLKCDGRDDCGDRSDESNCVPVGCRDNEFRCQDGQCIPQTQRCDGRYNCGDYSDERDCPPPTCPPGQFTCKSGECIYQTSVCDRRYDCRDRSDEENCDPVTCGPGQFTCDNQQCIDAARRCDRRYDCSDFSDERDCTSGRLCQPSEFRCDNGQCIDFRRKCDGRTDCSDSSDEYNCVSPCPRHQFHCSSSSECINIRYRCNGRKECRDGSDEVDCPFPTSCSAGQFRCQNSGRCIDIRRQCDRRNDCSDGSDEQNCALSDVPALCGPQMFVCFSGQCVPQSAICDHHWDCEDGTDEVNCLPSNPRRCDRGHFQCRGDGQCIPDKWRCNGRRECRDNSDEDGCPLTTPIEVTVSPTELRVREGQEAVFQCRATGTPPPLVRWSRGDQGLPFGASDVNGRLTIQQASAQHDGSYTCSALSTRGNFQANAVLRVEPFGPTQTPPGPGVCSRDQATCQNGQCIARDYICDGDFDCSDRSDEANCINPLPCEPNEFQCDNGKCAQKIWRCDGDDDCGDRSDESNCPTSDPNARCRQDEYECVAGDQCIPASYQCDGEVDCQDRSDEIGCAAPTVIQPPPDMAMAARGETITIECEAIGVPTPLIVWRLNWGHIGKPPRVSTFSSAGRGVLTLRQVRPEDEGAYTCEAINSKGSIFAQPDTIVTVKEPAGICQSPMFNAEASTLNECLRCFCFGITDTCVSSTLSKSRVPLSGDIVLVEKRTQDPIVGNFVQSIPTRREYVVSDYTRRVRGDYYWSMPSQFLGNMLTSYGTTLDYTILYQGTGEFKTAADVIIHGNGITLYHTHFTRPFNGRKSAVTVPFVESEWSKEQYDGRGDVEDLVRASRSDLMMVLQNVEYILIRSAYDTAQSEVRISEVSLGTGVTANTGQGRAVLVEECSCPTGYEGHSCEKCAGGFRRQQTGRYLGQCVACQCNGHSNDCDAENGLCTNCQHNTEGERCERCASGYYGNALQGRSTDCVACPCPLTDSRNQFSKECRLGPDNQVVCTACPEGYEGSRCERCAAGYQGNPMSPGDRCRPVGQLCDVGGSLSDNPDSRGQCRCKRNTQGPMCDTCRAGTFYLSEGNAEGCISCFCMGVTQRCSSTGQYKAQVGSPFTSSTQGFSLTDNQRSQQITDGLRLNPAQRELVFREFSRLDEQGKVYYWNLADKFLRSKVSSYGGSLRYTIQYTPGFDTSPNDFPDVELSGNDVTLVYRHSQAMTSDNRMAMTVPFTEQYWQRLDGTQATREYLMQALAKLDYIMVKATYTGSTSEASIRDVTMDHADTRRSDAGRALTVEECSCPAGYTGLSCEECASGYRRTGGGLYLGLCERCTCNGHSEDCDSTTGKCSNCRHNTVGDQCERCAPGYYGTPTRGTPNDCQRCACPMANPPNLFSPTCELDRDGLVTCTACVTGYEGRNCERCSAGYEGDPRRPGGSCRRTGGGGEGDGEDGGGDGGDGGCNCNAAGTAPGSRCVGGQCQCKRNVEGAQCDRCRSGYFNLEANTDDGCEACYCSGQSTECSSAIYYRDQIQPVYDRADHGFALTDRRLGQSITDGMSVDPVAQSVTFNRFSDLGDRQQRLFWHLPTRFRGNQILSYGGRLKFGLQFSIGYDAGESFNDVDIEILSGENRYFYLFNPQARPEVMNNYDILLHESTFRNLNRQENTRATFMKALSNIDAILIRATFHTLMGRATLKGLTMETAVPQDTNRDLLTNIEYCQCPAAYSGTSCEVCASGYNPVPGPSGLQCVACNCHGHGTGCDPVRGTCTGCQHNTAGERCERCAPGYYGDATVGTANDCRQCMCPLTIPSNNFSPTCFLDTDGRPSCDACPAGYTGRDCGQCDRGYRGNPRQPGGRCERDDGGRGRPQITLPETSVTEQVGGTVTIRVRITSRSPYSAQWSREDGRPLPDRASVAADYSLTIRSLIPSDAGRYIVIANNQYGQVRGEVDVTVQDDNGIMVTVEEPKERTMEAGTTVRFVCTGKSQVRDVTYTLAWERDAGQMDNRMEDNGQGVLTIRDVRPSDQGTYTCTGSNFYAIDTDKAILYVGVSEESPVVRLEPRYLQLQVGDPAEFKCTATGIPKPLIEWTGGQGGRLNPEATIVDGVFRIPAVRKADEAEYYCTAKNTAGSAQVRTIIYVTGEDRPAPDGEVNVDVGSAAMRVAYGQDARLDCRTRGTETVASIFWVRQGGSLPPGSRQENGILTIPRCVAEYAGRYLCTITLASGRSGTAYVDLSLQGGDGGGGDGGGGGREEGPTVTIEPEQQTISQGQSGTIRCVVTGNPTPSVRWSKVRGELTSRHQVVGNVLRISAAVVEDRGVYVCDAENSAGRARAHAIVEVERRELPEIEMYPENAQSINLGASALFQCRVTRGIPSPEITWSRVGNERMASTTEVLDNGVIRFNRVDGSEQGSYVCTATNAVGTVTSTATLNIAGRPRVSFSQQSPYRVRTGQRVYVECTGEGSPAPTVYWRFPPRADARPGQPGADRVEMRGSAVLDIQSVTPAQAGTYICVSENDGGRTEMRFEIVVSDSGRPGGGGRIGAPTFDEARKEMAVTEGSTVELTCSVAGTPTPTIRWSREGGQLPANHDMSGSLLRLHQMKPEDAGNYICTASNAAGSADAVFAITVQAAPSVYVNPPTQTVNPGGRIRLTCEARGTLPINTQWSKVGAQLSAAARERDGVLDIGTVTAADAGTYRCIAVNAAGRAEAYAEVIVSVPPTAVVSPRTMTQSVGQTVQLRCQGTGSPQPRIQWTKETGPLPEQHTIQDGVLTIYRLQREDAGRYICMVSSPVGTNRDYAYLIVDEPPDGGVVPGPNPEVISRTLTVGDSVELSCGVDGEVRGEFRWERVGQQLPPTASVRGSVLHIQRIQHQDAGSYRCVVTDPRGVTSDQVVEIRVEGPPGFRVRSQTRRATVGGKVTLSCTAFGTPTPNIVWRKRNGDLPREREVRDGELHILRVAAEDFGEYVCIAANTFGREEATVTLQQGELVPRFLQDPSSYIALQTLPEAYYSFDVETSFIPETSDGLLIYNGQMAGEGDFMLVGLREGRVEFRFDVGSGPAIIRSDPIVLGQWHTVRVKRSRKDGTLIVDGKEYTGAALGNFQGLDLVERMYIGGVPDYAAIARHAGYRSGFIGGLSRLEITGAAINLGEAALEMKGIVDYPACSSRPCANGGLCRPSSTSQGYTCTCTSGFSGPQCRLVGERCFEGACGVNGRCYDLPSGFGYRCVCPVGRTGDRCERGVEIAMPMFNRTSFIAYPTIQNAQTMVQLSMRIKPNSLGDSVLMYNAQADDGHGDFLSLAILGGKVEFRYDSGSGPAIITSTTPLRVGEWITIVAERNEKDGSLTVNGDVAVKEHTEKEDDSSWLSSWFGGSSAPETEEDDGVSEGSTVGLNLKSHLYIGGVDNRIRVNAGVGVDTGFTGCILELLVKGTAVHLLNDAVESANIMDCGQPSACAQAPCKNGGVCEEVSAGRYFCRCPPGFEGEQCDIEENICTRLNPCQHGGHCTPVDDTYVCQCQIGYTGRDCHIMAAVTEHASFGGNGYMVLPSDFLAEMEEEVIEVTITTDRSEGLILWQGQGPSVSGRGQDYVVLAVRNGHALFSFELGSGAANITSAIRVDDGRPHTLRATRNGQQGSLEIDEFTISDGKSLGDSKMLNVRGDIYIGGVPDAALMTDGQFRDGFIGCIRNIFVGETGPIDFSIDATGGMNVQSCTA